MSPIGYLLSLRVLPIGNLRPRTICFPEDLEMLDHGLKEPYPVRPRHPNPRHRMLNKVLYHSRRMTHLAKGQHGSPIEPRIQTS